jgi:hypothetical protein
VRTQFRATREAALNVVRAHIALAKAEAEDIADEAKEVSVLGCLGIAALLFLALLIPIGMTLFLGEALFGSMGWGILLATLAGVAIALTATMVALEVGGVQRSWIVAIVVGVIFAILFAGSFINQLWAQIGASLGITFGAEQGATPLVVGVLIIGIIGAVIGLIIGARVGGKATTAIGGLIGGLLIGAIAGAFSSNTFGFGPGVATGIAIGLIVALILLAVRFARVGVDVERLKERFTPQASIDMGKETIEWVRERTPLGPTS